jgi:hypothetical protein
MNSISRNAAASDLKPWYAHPWPWLLMLGPVMVIVAGIHTTWLAFTKQDALVVDDYYKQGKAINQDLRRDRAAAALGLQLAMHYDAAQGKLSGRLDGKVRLAEGVIRVRLVHSTLPEKDIRLEAKIDSDGKFEAVLPVLEKARWQVMVENAAGDWRLAGAWQWPLQRDVALKAQAS